MPFLPYGEYLSFEPLCLPVHPAGSVHLHDLDFGSALNHTRSSLMISYALEAYNRKLFQVCFLYASLANPIWKPTSREMRARDYPWKNSSVYTSEASMSSAEKPLSMPATNKNAPQDCEAFGAENETRTISCNVLIINTLQERKKTSGET